MAVATGRIIPSLALAILLGGFLAAVPPSPASALAWLSGPIQALGMLKEGLGGFGLPADDTGRVRLTVASWDPLLILVFVVLIMGMIGVMVTAGGLHGIVRWLQRFARGPRSTQVVTALMGLAVFIDDYANTMIVGSAMRSVTDAHRVSREKLAFLVDATSAPVAGLAVISTWVGYEVGLFDEQATSLHLPGNGYSMLFDALVFRFYCVLTLAFVLLNAATGRDFGPMSRAERRARRTGALLEPEAAPLTSRAFATSAADPRARVSALTAVGPILALFVFLMAALWIDGGGGARMGQNPAVLLSFAAWRDAISASNSIPLLALASAAGLVLAVGFARARAGLDTKTVRAALVEGMRSALLPVVVLSLAWGLKAACDRLGTGSFMVALMGERLPPALFPALTFAVAALISFSTGTSFGTMAILIPIAVPMALGLEGGAYGLVTMMSLGAVLDGSIFGDHCSPISDTTIMSSISSACDHLHHVRTQLPYSLMVAILALGLGYGPAAFGIPSWAGLLAATALIAATLYLFGRPAGAPGVGPSAETDT